MNYQLDQLGDRINITAKNNLQLVWNVSMFKGSLVTYFNGRLDFKHYAHPDHFGQASGHSILRAGDQISLDCSAIKEETVFELRVDTRNMT